ncbi:MAG TPA: Stf0 family sulfotransferase [Pseudomonadales bacterium]
MISATKNMPAGFKQRLKTALFGEYLPVLFDAAYYLEANKLAGLSASKPFVHFVLQGKRRRLAHHPLFNIGFYCAQNPDVDFSGISPVEHFLETGCQQGKNPNPLFDVRWYLGRYGDVSLSGMNPLVHYCIAGEAEGRLPNPLWDDAYIREQHAPGMSLAQYLSDASLWHVSPHPMFDAMFYQQQAKRKGCVVHGAPLAHFLTQGCQQGINPHPLFDVVWYAEQYGDVHPSVINPLVHYVVTGEAENRQPHGFFDPHWYRQHLQKRGMKVKAHFPAHFLSPEGLRLFPHPLWHQPYVNTQTPEGGVGLMRYLRDPSLWHINPHPLFDSAFYRRRASHRLPVPDDISPAEHFLVHGWRKAIDPHPLFDVDWYVLHFKKLYKTRRNPLAHYITFAGKSRRRPHALWDQEHINGQLPAGQSPVVLHDYLLDERWWSLQPHPLFDVDYYQEQLAALGIVLTQSPLEHYMREGCTLGLSPNRLFDPQWYRHQYTEDLKRFDGNAFTHFIEEGEFKGCNPHPCVDIDWYRKRLRDQGMADEGKYLQHYFSGALPHAPIHPLWDQAYVDAQRAGVSIRLQDYLHDACCWDLHPHPLFDPDRVRAQAVAAGLPLAGAPLDAFLRSDHSAHLSTHALFDPVWYLRHYEDVAELGRSPLLHYVSKGEAEGRNPHPLWDQLFIDRHYEHEGRPVLPVAYLKNPELRYINPHPLWDGAWMKARHARPVPFLEYLEEPAQWGLNTHPVFDAGFYRFQVERAGGCIDRPALQHFLETGWHEGHNPHRLFDMQWYLSSYSDVLELGLNPLLHYLSPGENRIRDPHPLFDCSYYCQSLERRGQALPQNLLVHFLTYPDEILTSPHPLWDVAFIQSQTGGVPVAVHQYLKDRTLWALNPHPLFDVAYYQHQVGKTDIAPLLHYVRQDDPTINPSYYFHTQWYVGRNQYLEEFSGKTRIPLVHFLLKGTKQGESPHPYFDSKWYADRHMQADRVSLSPVLHYLSIGWREGLNPNPMFNAAEYRKRHAIDENEDALKWHLRHHRVELPAVRNRFIDAFVCQPVPARPAGGDKDTLPDIRYLVLFTPRSGSSLLTDLMSSTGVLGKPGEWFNHDLASRARNTLPGGANTPEEFVRKIQCYRASENGVFGAQLVWPHLANVIEAGCENWLVGDDEFILVHLRQNIVAQAISLYLAAESGYFHSSQAGNARYLPQYSASAIASHLGKLVEQEVALSTYLKDHPRLRLHFSFYEELSANPKAVVDGIGAFIGVDCSAAEIHSPRQKIATGINAEFEQRFRDEYARVMDDYRKTRRACWESFGSLPAALFQ